MLLINLQKKFLEIREKIQDINFVDIELPVSFKTEYEKLIKEEKPSGYVGVQWAKYSSKIISSNGKSIYITNFWFYIAFELASYLEGLTAHSDIFKEIYHGEDLNQVAISLRDGVNENYKDKAQSYFKERNLSDEELSNFLEFVSNYKSWGGGKTIDRGDYYVSPLLQAANLLAETQSAIAEIAKQFYEDKALRHQFKPKIKYIYDAKYGDILLREKQRGLFVHKVIKYLVDKSDYKVLFNNLVLKDTGLNNYNLESNGYKLTTIFKITDAALSVDSLMQGNQIRFFEDYFLLDGKFYYLSNQWTDGTNSRLDIQSFIPLFNSLYSDRYKIESTNKGYTLINHSIQNYLQLPKPFILLAGISGTGKTRFVREQAKANGNNYELVAVRPDWHEPSDLLGYVSRLGNNGAQYITTDILRFLAKAWKSIYDANLSLSTDDNKLYVGGNKGDIEAIKPFWLCLDEMNLAPVEQYFADYLSILETREWVWDNDEFTYCSDALLNASIFKDHEKNLRKSLDLVGGQYDQLWQYFVEVGMPIPFNLIVAGTVNMDETTHGFSRKVIDRALSFDFGVFFPNDFAKFFDSKNKNKTLSYPIWSQADKNILPDYDREGGKSIAFLEAVNAVLKDTSFELAYRALNELLLAVAAFNPKNNSELQAVWDDFLMQKVLPRIEGDLDKLQGEDGILLKLSNLLREQLNEIWNEKRLDLYRDSSDNEQLKVECRSKAKLEWMANRLGKSGFTSFWP